jgi:hypothetical protein
VRVVKLPLEAFQLLAVTGAIAALVQHAVRVVLLLLQAFLLLSVFGESASFVQHFGHVSVRLDFDIH